MKKYLLLFLSVVTLLFSVACDTADIEVGVYENGTAYFNDSTIVPTMILQGEEEKEIEDKAFFGRLANAIQDKPVINEVCNCVALYNVAINEYRFALHTHGIAITRYDEGILNYKHIIYVGAVECDRATMDELFKILQNVG